MVQKRTAAQTALSKKQKGEFTGVLWELDSSFMPTWMQVGVQTVKSSPTHTLLSYVSLPLRWPPTSRRPPATRSFLGIFYQLSNPHGKMSLDSCIKSPCLGHVLILDHLLWSGQRKRFRGLGVVFYLARTGSYAQKGLGKGRGWGQSYLSHLEIGRGVILQRKTEVCTLTDTKKPFRAGKNRYKLQGSIL